jgi:hypothetical protein
LDTIEPIPSTTLLSAQEAKERLREIVEGFFFRRLREDGKAIQHLLVKSPPGLGKTKEAMEWATCYQVNGPHRLADITNAGVRAQVAIFVPRHELAREVKEVIERNSKKLGKPVAVPVLRGRDNLADKGRAPCRRWREAQALGGKGLPVYSNLCRRRYQREVSECPYFAECEYIREWRAAYAAPYVILVHSHLGVGWESTGIVRGASEFGDDGDDDQPHFHHSFNPTNAAIVVCDEDPTTSLIERSRIERDVIGAIAEERLGEHILAGLSTPVGLLDHLRDNGITPEQVRLTASKLHKRERKRGQITIPNASGPIVEKAVASAAPLVRLSRVLERLAAELASGRQGSAYSLVVNRDGLIGQGRRPWPFDHQRRLLVLDGTANSEILTQFVPSLVTVPEIRVQRNARIIQVSNATFYRGSLIKGVSTLDGGRKREPTARLLEIGEFIARTALGGKTLVVTNKPVRCALTGEDDHGALPISGKYRGADIAHFGNIRGSNEFKEHEIAIILGRDEPTVEAAEQRAMAIWYDTKELIRRVRPDYKGRFNYPTRTRRYLFRDGTTQPANVSVHPDPRVQAVVEQGREAEMVQAIDRLRLIHNEKRKTVYILCSIPLDIPVDELVTWAQLTGDRRWSDALAECDARGWDALPLASKEMSRLFPNLWSKALVRHAADPAEALAEVLGMSAEDIRVRDRPE